MEMNAKHGGDTQGRDKVAEAAILAGLVEVVHSDGYAPPFHSSHIRVDTPLTRGWTRSFQFCPYSGVV